MIFDIIAAIAAAFSFLTILPAPRVDRPFDMRWFPVVMPVVGFVVGLLGACAFGLLFHWRVSVVLRAVLMTLFYLFITGGLHMDGLMDTCDAVFSRKDRETRLKILSDTHAGSFAVMGCAIVLLLKAGIFCALFETAQPFETAFLPVMLTLIPVFSRIGLGILFYMPFAREDGLARMLGSARVLRDRYVPVVLYASFSLSLIPLGGQWISVLIAGLAFLSLWSLYCLRKFGGVTGDLMGASLELSETLMLLTLAASR